MNIPNLLSILRLMLLPCLMLEVRNGDGILALIVLSAMAITDSLDGYLARKLRLASEVGKLLDHGVDKIVTLSLSYALWQWRGLPTWAFISITLRELALLLGGVYLWRKSGKAVQSNMLGKVSGAFYTATVAAYILDVPFKSSLLYFTVAFMLLTALIYGLERFGGLMLGKEEMSV